MYDGMPLSQLEAVETIPQGSIFPMVAGDGSGTKKVTMESLVKETGNALKIGNLAELQTENKENLVAAINEATQSGGSAVSVDILDSKEEIEANTEAGKAAGASAVKEMFAELNDNLVSNVYVSTDGNIHVVKGGADSVLNFSKKITSVTKNGTTATASKKYVGFMAFIPSATISSLTLNGKNIIPECLTVVTGQCYFYNKGGNAGDVVKMTDGANYHWIFFFYT